MLLLDELINAIICHFLAGSDSVGARPDLLCGQNRFPPLLDPSVPAPPGGATAGPVQNNIPVSESATTFQSNALDIPGALGQVGVIF